MIVVWCFGFCGGGFWFFVWLDCCVFDWGVYGFFL